MLGNDFKTYRTNFGIKDAEDGGWASWDDAGVHYIALLNVFNFEKMGLMGNDQLSWLKKDLQSQYTSTPIVVFTHVPLYALFPQWGWTTEDGASALALLSGFDHVTVLNGHIHQIVTHVEGNIHFASATATAYPQPQPGTAPNPGPVTLAHDQLLHAMGIGRCASITARQALSSIHSARRQCEIQRSSALLQNGSHGRTKRRIAASARACTRPRCGFSPIAVPREIACTK